MSPKRPASKSCTTEMRLASATASTTAAHTITPKTTTSAMARPRRSRHRAGAAAHGLRRRWRRRHAGRRRRRRAASSRGSYRCRAHRVGPTRSGRGAPVPDSTPCRPRSSSWKHLYDEVVTSGLCTGCAGCVIACPHDVLGYRRHRGRLQAVPDRGGLAAPATAATARRAARRAPGPAPASGRGSPRSTSSCSAAPATPTSSSGIYKDIVLARATDPVLARGRPGRRARVGDARVRARARHHRRRARVVPRGRRLHVEGDPRRRAHTRGHHRLGRQPLHVLGEHARVHRRRRRRRRAHRARRA